MRAYPTMRESTEMKADTYIRQWRMGYKELTLLALWGLKFWRCWSTDQLGKTCSVSWISLFIRLSWYCQLRSNDRVPWWRRYLLFHWISLGVVQQWNTAFLIAITLTYDEATNKNMATAFNERLLFTWIQFQIASCSHLHNQIARHWMQQSREWANLNASQI